MNTFNKMTLAAIAAFILTACQSTQSAQQEPKVSAEPTPASISYTPRPLVSLQLNKNSVYSWHLGKNAQGERYLLVVLKKPLIDKIQTMKDKESLGMSLGNEVFKNASPIQGGFLVLHPLSNEWTPEKIAELLD